MQHIYLHPSAWSVPRSLVYSEILKHAESLEPDCLMTQKFVHILRSLYDPSHQYREGANWPGIHGYASDHGRILQLAVIHVPGPWDPMNCPTPSSKTCMRCHSLLLLDCQKHWVSDRRSQEDISPCKWSPCSQIYMFRNRILTALHSVPCHKKVRRYHDDMPLRKAQSLQTSETYASVPLGQRCANVECRWLMDHLSGHLASRLWHRCDLRGGQSFRTSSNKECELTWRSPNKMYHTWFDFVFKHIHLRTSDPIVCTGFPGVYAICRLTNKAFSALEWVVAVHLYHEREFQLRFILQSICTAGTGIQQSPVRDIIPQCFVDTSIDFVEYFEIDVIGNRKLIHTRSLVRNLSTIASK